MLGVRLDKDRELVQFLADPDNLDKFISISILESLGYGLTEDGEWAKLDK